MNKNIPLGLAVVTTGLSAGVFYAYSVSVNPAFSHLSDAHYIAAMQAINVVIQNPIFFFSFLGAAVFLPLAAYKYRGERRSRRFKLLAIAAVIYLVGTFGVTVAANVPLNDKLATFSPETASSQEAAAMRADYAGPWNNWHTIRTIAAVTSFALVVGACFSQNNQINKKTEDA